MALMNQLPDPHIQLMWSVAAPVVGLGSSNTSSAAAADNSTNTTTNTNSAVHESIRHGVLRVFIDLVTSLSLAHLVALVRTVISHYKINR